MQASTEYCTKISGKGIRRDKTTFRPAWEETWRNVSKTTITSLSKTIKTRIAELVAISNFSMVNSHREAILSDSFKIKISTLISLVVITSTMASYLPSSWVNSLANRSPKTIISTSRMKEDILKVKMAWVANKTMTKATVCQSYWMQTMHSLSESLKESDRDGADGS